MRRHRHCLNDKAQKTEMVGLEQDIVRKSEVHVPDAISALSGGLLLSIGLGVSRDHLDSTLKSSAGVRRYAHLDTFAALPDRS